VEGFRYLGYFLKEEKLKFEDWRWLLSKIENKIGHWCNRWLSLGGRFILIKSVLESQSVYWMALAAVPNSVLNKIHQMIFDFLWSGRWCDTTLPSLQLGGDLKIEIFRWLGA
jgi:hypothetical protein